MLGEHETDKAFLSGATANILAMRRTIFNWADSIEPMSKTIMTDSGERDYPDYIVNHQYKLASFDFMWNMGLAKSISDEMRVAVEEILQTKSLNDLSEYWYSYALEKFILNHMEKNIINCIPFSDGAVRMIDEVLLTTGFVNEKRFYDKENILSLFENEHFWKVFKKSNNLFEKIVKSEPFIENLFKNRNIDKNGVTIPVVINISELFLTTTFLY